MKGLKATVIRTGIPSVRCVQRMLLVVAFISSSPSFSESYIYESNRQYRSPMALGKGDAGLSTVDNQDAMFYNPAGIAVGSGIYKKTVFLSPTLEISGATRDLVRQVAIEKNTSIEALRSNIGKNQHIAFQNFTGVILRRAALGVLATGETNILVKKSPENSGLEEATAAGSLYKIAAFSLAEDFFDKSLFAGTTIKYVMRDHAAISVNIIDAENIGKDVSQDEFMSSHAGLAIDLGFIYAIKAFLPMNLGLQVENVGDAILDSTNAGEPYTMRQKINLGLSIKPATKYASMELNFDYRDAANKEDSNSLKKIHIGADLNLRGFFGLCAGLNQGYPAFSMYTDIRILKIVAGIYSEETEKYVGLRPDRRYFISIEGGI